MFTSKYGSILLLKPLVSNRPHFAIEIIFANNFPAEKEQLIFKIHNTINGHIASRNPISLIWNISILKKQTEKNPLYNAKD